MTALELALAAVKLAMDLYLKLGGDGPDLEQLATDCSVEAQRIKDQQAKDEAEARALIPDA